MGCRMRFTLKQTMIILLLLQAMQAMQAYAAQRSVGLVNSIHIGGGTLRVTNRTQPLSLLKTVPINVYTAFGQNTRSLKMVTASPLLDQQRGIYQSAIPGIGFSVCGQEGESCLVPGQTRYLAGAHYSLRLYATGPVRGGLYTPGALMQLQSESRSVLLTMNSLRIDSMPCSFTAKQVDVKFPDVALKSGADKLAEKAFSLPVSCNSSDDYRNVLVSFTYAGDTYQGNTMRTNLKGIGISLKSSAGNQIKLGYQAVTSLNNNNTFTAILLHIPGEQPQAGNINTSATVMLTMR